MDRFSAIVSFILDKRKILISLFLFIGLTSAIIAGLLLLRRPQIYHSRASDKSSPSSIAGYVSPKGWYRLTYDQKLWTYVKSSDELWGLRIIFNLNKEYGYARLDLIEGESNQDLDSLKNELIDTSPVKPIAVEPIQFKNQPAYLLSYQEKILGEDTYYYRQIVKESNRFLILEQRFPQLGYNQVYLENLLAGFSFSFSAQPQVKGVEETASKLSTVDLVDLIRPSIASIAHSYCIDINFLANQYNFCNLSKGSGFVVSEKGIIATNGHVAKIYPEEGLTTNLLQGEGRMFAIDLIKEIYSAAGQNPTQNQMEDFYQQVNSNPQYLDRFLTEIFKLLDRRVISIKISKEKFYVNLGNEPVNIDYQKLGSGDIDGAIIPSSTTYSASLLDFDYPNKYSYDAIINRNYQSGSDIALLQIKNTSSMFPILNLGDTQNLREGAELVIAGYPVIVEGGTSPQATISYKTSTKPTITRGIISAIKQDVSGKTVFQTDASIDHGNSGGPAVNSEGEVIGIATFFFESKSGNFNFLRSVDNLKELMSKNNVDNKPGNLTNTWRAGLAKYRSQHYKQAIKYFKQVQNLSTSHPTAKELINMSEDAIKKGKSLEGFTGFIKSQQATNNLLAIFGGISLSSFMFAGFLTALPLFRRNT